MDSQYRKILDGAGLWGSYYRANPDKFAEEYLHLRLHLFQKIVLVMMFWANVFVFIASRGIGKTFMSAIYCVTRCTLYPGTKICIASGTRGQAILVLEKILYELKPLSPELANEINDRETKVNNTLGQIAFKNGSMIKVVTASDSARGNRCNVLLLDEFRLMSKFIIDTVLDKFLTYQRTPLYSELSNEERKAEILKEKNLTMYLSSAWYKDHWAYTKCADTFEAMTSGKRKQFVCAFPFWLAIREGMLDPEKVASDMEESTFSEVLWKMEMEAEWYGSDADSFFDLQSISKNRHIQYPMLPDELAVKLNLPPELKITTKPQGTLRILSVDIALMASKKHNNDATAMFINQLTPTKSGRYVSNIIYAETNEGLTTKEQAFNVRKLYDEFSCDYLVLDCYNSGLGVYDALTEDMPDPETGEIYPAISCMNDPTMAMRCKVPGAPKVIWSVKANAQFNSDCAYLLREAFRSGRVRLLLQSTSAIEKLSEIKGFDKLSDVDKIKFQLPYIQTDLLVDELIKLRHEEDPSSGKIKLRERSGMRKDRYSSLSYNYYFATQIETKLNKKTLKSSSDECFIIKPPSGGGRKVVSRIGQPEKIGWRYS